MPTGYTAELDDTNIDTATWIKSNLVRAFGMCVMMRDDGSLDEDAIKKKLEADSSTYHEDRLKESIEELEKYTSMSDSGWQTLYKKYCDKTNRENKESIKKARVKMLRHAKARSDLLKVKKSTSDDITKNVVNFGIEQLDVCKSECEPYISTINKFPAFRSSRITSAERSIQYHTDEMAKEIDRDDGRLEAYMKVVSEVDRILGEVD